MTDIYDKDAKLLEAIRLEIDADPELYLGKTKPLKAADLVFMATIIQAYSYADLNGRLIIDHIRHAAFGPEKQNAGRLHDAQVFAKLQEAAGLLPDGKMKEGIIRAASTLALHVIQRHHFAHWAIRRVKGHDVFVFYTYNAKEAEKRLGQKVEPGEIIYGAVGRKTLRAELKKIDGHASYLAAAAVHIFKHLENWKNHFAEQKAVEQAAKYDAGKYKKGAKGPPVDGDRADEVADH